MGLGCRVASSAAKTHHEKGIWWVFAGRHHPTVNPESVDQKKVLRRNAVGMGF